MSLPHPYGDAEMDDHDRRVRAALPNARELFLATRPLGDENPPQILANCVTRVGEALNPITREHFTPEGYVALEIPQSALRALHDGEPPSDGTPEMGLVLKKLGIIDKADMAYLVKDQKKLGVRIVVEPKAYGRMAQRAAEKLLDIEQGSAWLGYDIRAYRESLKDRESTAYKAVINAVEQGGFPAAELKSLMGRAAGENLHELAADLRDMALSPESKPRKLTPEVKVISELNQVVGEALRLVLSTKPIFSVPPSNRPRPASFRPAAILEISAAQLAALDKTTLTTGNNGLFFALRDASGLGGGNFKIVDKKGTPDKYVIIEGEPYKELTRRALKTMLNPEKGAKWLGYEQPAYLAMLRDPESEPSRTIANLATHAHLGETGTKLLTAKAARLDCMELAAAIRDIGATTAKAKNSR